MNYLYYVTKAIRNKWNKWNLGNTFDSRLKKLENSHNELRNTIRIKENLILKNFNGKNSRSSFVFYKKYFDDKLCIYVLRRAAEHDQLKKDLNYESIEK
jgi:hypothetical protein